jgi:hypothetical protein
MAAAALSRPGRAAEIGMIRLGSVTLPLLRSKAERVVKA